MEREFYMRQALALAREAMDAGEVPVGCGIADAAGRIVGTGRNRREETADATAHAEIDAIRAACATLGTWHLTDCTMFVTLEPCPMCTGAIIMGMKAVVKESPMTRAFLPVSKPVVYFVHSRGSRRRGKPCSFHCYRR